jgi:hypothetical protein
MCKLGASTMQTYSISYDLDKPNRNYDGVIAKIKKLANGYCRANESHWLINSDKTAVEICNAIAEEIDTGDTLFVHNVGDYWAGRGLKKEVADWLKNNWRSSCTVG